MRFSIHNIAEFLLLNTETVENYHVNLRMPLLYFFFSYAKRYKRQGYTDFAFELLEEYLSISLAKINIIEEARIEDLEIGCSLMEFISMKFFESEDIDEILIAFDKLAIVKMKNFLNVDLNSENINNLLLLSMYFMNRYKAIKKENYNYLYIKEHLSTCFLKLISYRDLLERKEITDITLMRLFFYEYKKVFKHDHSVIERLNISSILYKQKNDFNLEMSLLHYMCSSKNIELKESDKNKLLEVLKNEIKINIHDSYNENIIIPTPNLQRRVIFSSVFLQIMSLKNSLYLAVKTKELIS